MTTDCIRPEDIAGILALAVDDPRRRHLEGCLHCRALAHAYREFHDAEAVRPGFDLDKADGELADRLAGMLAASPPARSRRGSAWRVRGWYAAAAVLLVCAGIFLARDLILEREARLPGGGGLVRGETEDVTGLAWRQAEDGRWQLTWDAATPGTPLVVFLDAELMELTRRPLAAPDGVVAASDLAAPADAAYLQLVFEETGDVVARSALVAARLEDR
jgi:hypothetical protein